MREGWEFKKISDLFDIKPSKSEVRCVLKDNDPVSFLPMEDLGAPSRHVEATKVKKLKEVLNSYTYFAENDVLLAKITPCFENGKVGVARNLVNGVGFGSSEYFVFRPKGEVISDYLFYFFTKNRFRAEGSARMSGAVGHKRVPMHFIENYRLPFPTDHSEQKLIVEALDKSFAAIEKAKANIERNLQNAKQLFESYLQKIYENSKWEPKPFGEVCELIGGSQPSKNNFIYEPKADYIRLIQVRDYKTDKYATYIPKSTTKKLCAKDDIMIGRYGPPIFGIFKGLEGAYNVALMKAVVNEQLCDRDYFFWFLNTSKLRKFVERSSKRAAGQDGVRKELLDEYPVPIPSINEQRNTVQKLRAIRLQTEKLERIYRQKLEALEDLKNSLLEKAFSGELTAANPTLIA